MSMIFVSDLLDEAHIGWHASHGDPEAVVRAIETARAAGPEKLREMGDRAEHGGTLGAAAQEDAARQLGPGYQVQARWRRCH